MSLDNFIVPFNPVIDTAAYASGDVLFVATSLAGMLALNQRAVLNNVVAIDEDDQGQALTLLFFDTNVAFGTINAAPNISDADGRSFLGAVPLLTTDWIDLGGVRVASKQNLGIILKPATDTQNVFVAALCTSGTPTYTASGLKFRFGLNNS